jgi:hypothetical protein
MNTPLGAVSSSRRSIQIGDTTTGQCTVGDAPVGTGRHHLPGCFAIGEECDIVIVVGHIMSVAMVCIECTDHFIVSMAMLRDVSMMIGHNLCELRQIMCRNPCVGYQQHSDRQNDGQHKPDMKSNLLSHFIRNFAGFGPLALSP